MADQVAAHMVSPSVVVGCCRRQPVVLAVRPAVQHNRHRLSEPMRLPVRQAEHVSGNQAARRPQRVVAVTEIPRSLMSTENETMAD
ncbi:hypothetical protein GA0070215_1243 [Micromonospora marina]|uniref:Uncharacterized protein n=1 Tax=Micromonospora marina TaxID=307120 RepID=A0A1C5A490_9ACTN|nr:hypothetical protein GA0070215_1243 [Micromonospora marina]